jgi:uroporphyrinogen-III synthase
VTTPGPLAGRTVVVTRATDQAGTLRGLLEAEGAEVVEVPLVRITAADDGGRALAAALAEPDHYDWIVVTSPNGAARVKAVLADRPTRARIAAVGTGTAGAVGRPVSLVPSRQVAEGLLAEFPIGPGRVLLVQGDRARPTLAGGLRALGWSVDAPIAYRTLPASVDPGLLARVEEADALTFASGSAARAYIDAVGAPPRRPAVVSIGPVTTEVARQLGFTVAATADPHSLPGLVAAVIARLTGSGGGTG